MNGKDRYDVKAHAGWSRTRVDGSQYDRRTDDVAANAEAWFAEQYHGLLDDSIALRGDAGYDVVVDRRGCQLRVDVIHAGFTRDGEPRDGRASCVIVNPDSNKLIASDVLVFVGGPPFVVVGCIYTTRFLALAELRDHGFGLKFSLHASRLLHIDAILRPASGSRTQ